MDFEDAVEDLTAGQPKIPQEEYMENGALPVIDQGERSAGGWTDDEKTRCTAPLPTILFGDHTNHLKFMEAPFALGADGVKVLAARGGSMLKPFYLFNCLRSFEMPDVGYSRHFKFLKRNRIPVPPPELQEKFEEIGGHMRNQKTARTESERTIESLEISLATAVFGP